MADLEMPTKEEVKSELSSILNWMHHGDVRLNVHDDGSWSVLSGDASYDTDHNGYWGASSIDDDSDLDDIAESLIDDVLEHHSQSE